MTMQMMQRDSYIEAMHRYFQHVDEHALDPLMEMFAEEASLVLPITPEPIHGRAAIRAFFGKLFDDHPVIRTELLELIVDVEGEQCASEQRVTLIRRSNEKVVFQRNTNHFFFESRRIVTVRGFNGRA